MQPSTTEGASRPGMAAFLLVPLLYGLGAVVGGRLLFPPEDISLLWPPNAVLIAVLLRYDGARWWVFAASCLLVEIAADLPRLTLAEALVFGLANVLEATVAWQLLRRWGFDPRFERISDVGRFLLAGPFTSALLAAIVGSVALHLVSPGQRGLVADILVWWFGDGLGVMVFTPVYLAHAVPRTRTAPTEPTPVSVDVVMALLGSATLVWFLGPSSGGLLGGNAPPVALLPIVLYAAARLPFRHVTLLVMAVALVVMARAVGGRPLFGVPDLHREALWTQEYVLITSVLALGLSSLLANLRIREAEIRAANTELRVRATALERNNRELQRIAYVAAHDLQTPLRTITSFSQLLRREHGGRLGETGDDWLRRVVEGARRLEALIRALGEVAAVDASGAPFAPVDMNHVVDDVVGALDERIRAAGAVVTRGELPTVPGDHAQLARLVKELICNALAHPGAGPPRVHIGARPDPCVAILSVQDDGAGIPPEERERIFDLFYRLPGEREEGVGAGLALCARIVHRHGGRIWLEDTPGGGTTFLFSVPVTELAP